VGLVTANGGYVTKHALGLYSSEPPPAGEFRWADVQQAVDEIPGRDLCEQVDDTTGTVTIESWVVSHDRTGNPERALAACLLDDGRRAWAFSEDEDTVTELRSGTEQIGRRVKLGPDGTLRL
jgi:acetyl-CoA C-acetyltransferase